MASPSTPILTTGSKPIRAPNNIISSAKEICQEERICSVIGGFHLLHTPSWQMEKTVAYLAKLGAKEIYAAHCTDLAAKIALAKELPLQEAGVGRILSYC